MPNSMPCECKNKVDRHDSLKVQCIVCKGFYHGLCYRIQDSEIELVKDTFKCNHCLAIRRRSVSESFVIPVSTNSAVSAAEGVSERNENADASNLGTSGANAILPSAIKSSRKPMNASSSSSNAIFVNKVQGAFDHILSELSVLRENNVSLNESNKKFDDQFSLLIENQKYLLKEVAVLKEHNVSLKKTNESLADQLTLLNIENSGLKDHVTELVLAIQASNAVAMQSSKTNAVVVNHLPIAVAAEKKLKTKSKSKSNAVAVNFSPVVVAAEQSSSSAPNAAAGNLSNLADSLNKSWADVVAADNNNANLLNNNVPADGTLLNPNWTRIEKLKKTKKAVIGTCANNDLNVFTKMKYLHISAFKKTVTEADIINYLSNTTKIAESQFVCYKLLKSGSNMENIKFVNFKLGVTSNHYDMILKPDVWPLNIKVRPFIFLEKKEVQPVELQAMPQN